MEAVIAQYQEGNTVRYCTLGNILLQFNFTSSIELNIIITEYLFKTETNGENYRNLIEIKNSAKYNSSKTFHMYSTQCAFSIYHVVLVYI